MQQSLDLRREARLDRAPRPEEVDQRVGNHALLEEQADDRNAQDGVRIESPHALLGIIDGVEDVPADQIVVMWEQPAPVQNEWIEQHSRAQKAGGQAREMHPDHQLVRDGRKLVHVLHDLVLALGRHAAWRGGCLVLYLQF